MTYPIEFTAVEFRRGDRPVLTGLDLHVCAGEKLGLAGAMGSGKTTLMHLIVGLLKPTNGVISILGKPCSTEDDFREVRKRVGLVFQDSDDQLFCPTVLEDVAFGPLNLGLSVDAAKQRAAETLAQVGMAGFEERVTYRLSGGEKRLIALATVLAMRPAVLLLDEPTNGLDETAATRIGDLLRSLPQSMIIVSHDQTFLPTVASRQLKLEGGRLQGPRF